MGHRGDPAHQPENTLASFLAAADAGADMVELDVRLTADGVAVAHHDPYAGGRLLRAITFEELRRVDVSDGHGSRVEVPAFGEVARAMEARGLGLDVEIKNIPGEPDFDPDDPQLEAALAVLTSFAGPLIVSSFNWLTIERCLEAAPAIPTGFLSLAAVDPHAGLAYASDAGHAWVLPAAPELLTAGETFVTAAHAAGVRVGTWTVDESETQRKLFGWGVDAVVTNDPGAARAVRDSGQQ